MALVWGCRSALATLDNRFRLVVSCAPIGMFRLGVRDRFARFDCRRQERLEREFQCEALGSWVWCLWWRWEWAGETAQRGRDRGWRLKGGKNSVSWYRRRHALRCNCWLILWDWFSSVSHEIQSWFPCGVRVGLPFHEVSTPIFSLASPAV